MSTADNPYSAPTTDTAPPVTPLAERGPMPGVVIAVVVLVALYMLLSLPSLISSPIGALLRLAISALILVGLIRGHALAWQWGMIMPVIAVVFGLLGLAVTLGSRSGAIGIFEMGLLLLLLAPNVAIPVLLARRSSRLYFRLQCPRCGALKVRAADFLFSRRRCAKCNEVWGGA